MDKEVILSVIMPVYNGEKHLEHAIESVLSQEIDRMELIVINDESTDQTGDILKKWETKDSRVQVIYKEKEGVSVARNAGIAAAKGKYVTFVDADDYLEFGAYKEVLEKLEDTDVHAAMFGFYDQTEEQMTDVSLPWDTGTVLSKERIWGELIPYMIKVFPKDPLSGNLFGSVWRIVVRRDAILTNKVVFDKKLQIAEDFDFCMHLFSKLSGIVIVNKCLYHYMRWGNTTMAVYRKNHFQEGRENQLRLKRFLQQEGYYEALKQRYVGSYVDMCIGSLVNFVRPGAPRLFQKVKELREVVNQIAEDEIYETLNCIPLTKNQKLVLQLIRHKKVWTILMITKIRQMRK